MSKSTPIVSKENDWEMLEDREPWMILDVHKKSDNEKDKKWVFVSKPKEEEWKIVKNPDRKWEKVDKPNQWTISEVYRKNIKGKWW